jgi:thiamine transport system permease protein
MPLARRTPRTLGFVALAALPLAVLAIFFFLPLGGMLKHGLWQDGHLNLSGVGDVLGRRRSQRVIWFTLWSSAVATAVSLLLGLPVAFVLYRLRFAGRAVLRALVTIPFVLPTVVVGVAFRTLLAPSGPLGGLGLDGSATAIVAALVFFNISVVVRTVGTAWESLDPHPAEVAAGLGARPSYVARTITLPMLRPAITSAASVVFLFCATAFGVVLTLGGLHYSTVETEIYLLTTKFLDLKAAAVLSLLQLVVVAVLLGLAARAGAGRGGRGVAQARRPHWRDVPVMVACGLVLTAIALPLIALVVRSLYERGHWTFAGYRDLGSQLGPAIRNSLVTALGAGALATALGVLVAVLATRRTRTQTGRRTAKLFDGVFMLPLGVSAVTIGFGFLITLDRPPLDLRSSSVLVMVAQALIGLPLVVRTLVPALQGIDEGLRESAAALGARPLRVFANVELPLIARPLLIGAGLAFAVAVGEFGATSFLARPDRLTLPVLIYQLIGRPGVTNFQMALAASVILAAVTAVVMGLVEAAHRGSSHQETQHHHGRAARG